MDWTDFLTALGLAAAMEGAIYAIAPDGAKRAYLDFFTLPVETRRKVGVGILAFGVLMVWLARS